MTVPTADVSALAAEGGGVGSSSNGTEAGTPVGGSAETFTYIDKNLGVNGGDYVVVGNPGYRSCANYRTLRRTSYRKETGQTVEKRPTKTFETFGRIGPGLRENVT